MATNRAATSDDTAASNPFEGERAHQWVEEGTASSDESADGRDATESSATDHEDAPNESGKQPLGYTRCPECNAREFVARQLVYETRTFDEHGTVASIDSELRGELEFVCTGCATCLREMPAARRTFYDEIGVLQRDLQGAVRSQLRLWGHWLRTWLPVL